MTKITYEIVQHDGGWAYRVDGVFSETFPSHDLARLSAQRAAKEQTVPGDTTGISTRISLADGTTSCHRATTAPRSMSKADRNSRPPNSTRALRVR